MRQNVTSTDELVTTLSFVGLRRLLPGAKPEELTHLAKLYPSDPSQGSPFNTGSRNAFNAVSKQVAALFGDIAFQVSDTDCQFPSLKIFLAP